MNKKSISLPDPELKEKHLLHIFHWNSSGKIN